MDRPPLEPMAEALISSRRLAGNLRAVRAVTGEGVRVMGVVKANAYGHGMCDCAALLQAGGVDDFGVANIAEAVALRSSGRIAPNAAILAFSAPLASQLRWYLEHDIEMTLCDLEALRAAQGAAARFGRKIGVHLKVDTGMGRLGLPPGEAMGLLGELEACPDVELRGIYTHFAESGAPGGFTARQLDAFKALTDEHRHATGRSVPRHAANSGAILSEPASFLDMVRPGLLLYGYHPLKESPHRLAVEPVMQLEARVLFVKEVEAGTSISYNRTWQAQQRCRIATIGAGYADGYHRQLSGKGVVGIGGKSFRQVGTVTMDQIMVDLGEDRSVRAGDRAILFGYDGIGADQLAEKAGTISYELLCAVSARVPRRLH